MSSEKMQDRVIVVMGGTTGIGLAGGLALVRAGARVVSVGRNAESAQRAKDRLGGDGVTLVGDAMQEETTPRAIQLALKQFGRFDGLYHVAGGSGRQFGDGPLHEVTAAGIDETLRLNLSSLILSNRAAVRAFQQQQSGGAVLNVGSVLGYAPSPRHFATHVYAAAKSAAIGFTKSCAAYYASANIRFNLLAPALVDTPMARRAVADPQIGAYIARKQPLDGGRSGAAEDLDGAVVYFLSDASKFVTGQVLAVDGGWSVSEGGPSE